MHKDIVIKNERRKALHLLHFSLLRFDYFHFTSLLLTERITLQFLSNIVFRLGKFSEESIFLFESVIVRHRRKSVFGDVIGLDVFWQELEGTGRL